MEARVSSKGQLVLPSRVRRKLGIVAGDSLVVRVERGNVVLSTKGKRPRRARLATSRWTGLPVIEVSAQAGSVTSEVVEQLLGELS